MPLIVLTAGDTYANLPDAARAMVDPIWKGLHQEVASRSTRGQALVVEGSGHMMMLDRPNAIVAAVDRVASAAIGSIKTNVGSSHSLPRHSN
jgi:hypothetical protein